MQNRLIQTSKIGGQWYSDTSPLVFPDLVREQEETIQNKLENEISDVRNKLFKTVNYPIFSLCLQRTD
jgi:hypothetical protein